MNYKTHTKGTRRSKITYLVELETSIQRKVRTKLWGLLVSQSISLRVSPPLHLRLELVSDLQISLSNTFPSTSSYWSLTKGSELKDSPSCELETRPSDS